jgi:hypothetical protein
MTAAGFVTKFRLHSVAVAALLLAGGLGHALARSAWAARHSATGNAPSLGGLAGFRALAADVLWLKTYGAWERRDGEAIRLLIETVVAIDPRPLAYWVEGARMLAYDLAHWDVAAPPAESSVPLAVRQRAVEQHANIALHHLRRARALYPSRSVLWIEEGNIHLNVRGDIERAAEAYRQAALLPDAPYYAARIYAELLRRSGRLAEAHAWLTELHPRLTRIEDPWERELASPDIVLARIHELERELGARLPPGQ